MKKQNEELFDDTSPKNDFEPQAVGNGDCLKKYYYTVCCGDEIRRTARWFPKLHWCKACKALNIYRRVRGGLYIKIRFFGKSERQDDFAGDLAACAQISTVE